MKKALALLAVLVLTSGFTVTYTDSGVRSVDYRTFCPSGCTTTVAGGATTPYVPPAGLMAAIVECLGGGGGSGGVASSTGNGGSGGGGAGAYARKALTAAQIGASQTITIGAAGTGGAVGASGVAGGQSSFGAFCTAPGGNFSVSAAANTAAAGGAASSLGVGDLTIAGGGGENAYGGTPTAYAFRGARGGTPALGLGFPAAQNSNAVPVTSKGFGAGADGVESNASGGGFSGGAGSPGIVIVTEYIR